MRYTGDEHFKCETMPQDFCLSDFWSWFSSDLLNNITRGVLAEFIVCKALGLNTDGQRQSWNPFDLMFNGVPVEVKSSAYIQSSSFNQPEGVYSKPIFGIAPTHFQDEHGNIAFSRKSSVYVFCLLNCKDREKIDPLRLEQWRFYILPTSVLDEKCGEQKTITLSALAELNPVETDYYNLKSTVEQYAKAA